MNQSLSSLIIFVLLITSPHITTSEESSPKPFEDCTLKCGNGRCIRTTVTVQGETRTHDSCECHEGWGGARCDETAKMCPDGHKCFNGAECKATSVEETKGTVQYTCDCAKAYDHSAFSGEMCEVPATEYCEYGASVSKIAFCTNGGRCSGTVTASASGSVEHPGCICPDGYVGEHCEYLKGTEPTPIDDPSSPTSVSSSVNKATTTTSKAPSASAGSIVVRVVAILFIIGIFMGMVFIIRRSVRKRRQSRNPRPVINLATGAGASEDHSPGRRSKVVMNGETTEEDYEEIDII